MVSNEEQMPEAPPRPNQAWMVTFTDLVSLMLTFFVLLFSMSTLKMDEWDAMTDTLTQTLNPSRVSTVAAATAEFNIGTFLRKEAINLDYLYGLMDDAMKADPLLKEARLMLLEDRLLITLPGDLLFQPGKAIMPEEAQQVLFSLGGVLANIPNQVGVAGHTDPLPAAAGGPYASNWELSLARAAAVANALKRAGYGEDIIAYGYADSRYYQLPQIADAERRALGRRVDISVLPTVGGD